MINQFRDDFYFLSNFFGAVVTFEGVTYLNNEAAFQAQKVLDKKKRAEFQQLGPSEAKKLGRSVSLRRDWEEVKDDIMYRICKQKFTQNETLKDALLATGDEELIEGNTWNDRYWGVGLDDGKGLNKLGKILMQIRQEFRVNT